MPTSYREPARRARVEPLERPVAHRSAALLGSLAALAGAGALALTQLEALAIASVAALATAALAWRAVRELRRAEAVASFLGSDEVVCGPGTWTSPDGCRRVRRVASDARLRFEHLDPASGETVASYRALAPVGPGAAPVEALERWVAPVRGRACDARCFDGLPPELGGEALPLTGTRYAVLERSRGGVLLVRRDAGGACIGDTFHDDLASALRQLEAEHGEHVGRLRELRALEPAPVRACWDGAPASRLAI